MLLHENRLKPYKVHITQFEIGLNLNVSYLPLWMGNLESVVEESGYTNEHRQRPKSKKRIGTG